MKIKILLIIFAIACGCIMAYSFSRYKVFESDEVLLFSAKYFAIPVFVIITPLCYVFYRAVVLPEEDYVEPGFKRTFKIIQGTLAYSVSISVFLIFTLNSLTLITNEYLGSKTVHIDAHVVRSYKSVHHGNESFYVNLKDRSGKETSLKVDKLYKTGTVFNAAFKRGYWGLLYRVRRL